MKSKIVTILGLVLVIACLILNVSMHVTWWSYIDIFFVFMAIFCRLMTFLVAKTSPSAAASLNRIAFWCLVLAVISFIVIFFVFQGHTPQVQSV